MVELASEIRWQDRRFEVPLERIRQQIKPWLDCGVSGLIIRQGAPFVHDRIDENVDAYRVIAEEAGRKPRC